MKNHKQEIFEKKFSDNYRPGLIEKLAKIFEKYRSDVMLSLIENKKGIFVDLACGNGDFIVQVSSYYRSLYGFDISKKRISNAKNKLKDQKKIELKVKDLDEGIPVKSYSVNTVVCEASLAYFIRPDLLLEEVFRILKPGGEFIVQIGNYAYLTRRVALFFGNLPKISSFKGFGDGGMIHYFTYFSLKNLLEEKGFEITRKSNSGVFYGLRKIWPELLSSDIIYRAVKK